MLPLTLSEPNGKSVAKIASNVETPSICSPAHSSPPVETRQDRRALRFGCQESMPQRRAFHKFRPGFHQPRELLGRIACETAKVLHSNPGEGWEAAWLPTEAGPKQQSKPSPIPPFPGCQRRLPWNPV